MTAIQIDGESFKTEVLESKTPVVVDFWAEWCSPCKVIAPLLDEISYELKDQAKIVKVNIDTNAEIATEFGVRSIPTLMVFKEGEVIDVKVGALPKVALLQWIQKAIA